MRISLSIWIGLVSCVPCFAVPATQPAERLEIPGRIDAATVYRGQALVTRLIDVPGPAGLREIVVTGLPAQVVGASIHAESADGVEVRSVLYRERSVEHDIREEVRQLDEQIRDTQDQLAEKQKYLELVTQRKGYLDKLEQFVAPTATVELTKGVLNAETLEKLTLMIAQQRKDAAAEELKLNLEARDLKEQLEVLSRKKQEVTTSSAKTAREAVVFVNLRNNGGAVRLRYLVNNAGWSPSYNVRAETGHDKVTLDVNASVQQMSGEDWNGISMTLSTATPALVAKAPTLSPMTISLAPAAAPAQQAELSGGYKQARQQIFTKQTEANIARNAIPMQSQPIVGNQSGTAPAFDLSFNDQELNRLANDLQNLDLQASGRIVADKTAECVISEDVSVTYLIADRISLPSRSDRQMIQVAALPLPGEFYKVATPLLTPYVYDEAAVTNTGDLVLLAGPVSTYMGGRFVGNGTIPTVSIGETFKVGFGVDSSLRAGRELVKKDETVQGGNRVVEMTYRLTIENFGTSPTKVRLYDRMPETSRHDIKISLISSGQELSQDAHYRQSEYKKNILRWEVEVPAKSIGPQAKSLEYQFKLEYDKQMTIAGLAVAR